MKSVLNDASYEDALADSLQKFLDTYSVVTKQKEELSIEPWKIDCILPLTRVMSLIHSLYDKQLRYDNKNSDSHQ